jgi:hypothetical protein
VEDAEQDSTRSVGRWRGSEWHVGLSGGRRWHGRCCDGERRRNTARAGGGGVARQGKASARAGSSGAETGASRARAQRGAGAAGTAHRAGAVAVACGRGEIEEREREVDEGGPKCNFRELQGPYYNVPITFQPVLKWRWAQKQKCMVFQNVQICFKVHPQKS